MALNLSARSHPEMTFSPLLALPLELRIQIYAHALSHTPAQSVLPNRHNEVLTPPFRPHLQLPAEAAVLAT